VQRQTYPNIEHIVVSDGPDDETNDKLFMLERVRHFQLGVNWKAFTGNRSWGAMPRLAGTLLARGEFIAYVDDDDELLPEHVAKLLALCQETQSDFVISQFRRKWADGRPDEVIGNGRIEFGHIGTPCVLHRRECLVKANWGLHGYAEDFALFDAWRRAGLRYWHLPEVTSLVYK
jgi:glycosyltransferase involved in cell wall biosynthesis